MDLCQRGHDRDAAGRYANGACRACAHERYRERRNALHEERTRTHTVITSGVLKTWATVPAARALLAQLAAACGDEARRSVTWDAVRLELRPGFIVERPRWRERIVLSRAALDRWDKRFHSETPARRRLLALWGLSMPEVGVFAIEPRPDDEAEAEPGGTLQEPAGTAQNAERMELIAA
jgi:hypothetical protein